MTILTPKHVKEGKHSSHGILTGHDGKKADLADLTSRFHNSLEVFDQLVGLRAYHHF